MNEALIDRPELVNEDPYGEGWLFRVSSLHDEPCKDLLDAAGYAARIASEAH